MTLLSDILAPGCTLPRQQAIIVREILDRGEVSRARLMHVLWGDDPNGGPLYDAISVLIAHIRRHLAPGVTLHCRVGFGWSFVIACEAAA